MMRVIKVTAVKESYIKVEIWRVSKKIIPKYYAGKLKPIIAIKMYKLNRNTRQVKAEVRKAVRDFEKLSATEAKTNPKEKYHQCFTEVKHGAIIKHVCQNMAMICTRETISS